MAKNRSRSDPDPFQDAIDAVEQAEGLRVDELEEGDVIDVETTYHLYTFILHDPAAGSAEAMSNSDRLPDPVDAIIVGSLLGTGSAVCGRWIGVGYRLEIVVGEKTYLLSETKRIAVNNITILPRPEGATAN